VLLEDHHVVDIAGAAARLQVVHERLHRPGRHMRSQHPRPGLRDRQAGRGLGERRLPLVRQQATGDLLNQEEAEHGDDDGRYHHGGDDHAQLK
jgi:hypothetical protein